MEILGEDFVRRISDTIDQKGLKRDDFYKITPSSSLSRWKKGEGPNAYTLYKIAQFLGESIDYLITGKLPLDMPEDIMVIAQEAKKLNKEGRKAALGAIQGLISHYPLEHKEEKPMYAVTEPVPPETKEPEPAYSANDGVIFLDWNVVMIPYYGKTAAGRPIDITAVPEFDYPFPENAIHGDKNNYFCLTVCGTSMTEANIYDGDMALIRHTKEPEDGEIMLVRYGNESTLKRIRLRRNTVYLCWEDGSGQKIKIDSDEYEIQGRLINLWRKPGKP
jgi:SOS-response transcriptional repressor LexA